MGEGNLYKNPRLLAIFKDTVCFNCFLGLYELSAIGNQDVMRFRIPSRVGAVTLRRLFHSDHVAYRLQFLLAYAVHLHELINMLEVALLPVGNNFFGGFRPYPRQLLQF